MSASLVVLVTLSTRLGPHSFYNITSFCRASQFISLYYYSQERTRKRVMDQESRIVQQALADTIGALLIGMGFAAALYGVNCAQCLIFFRWSSQGLLNLRLIIAVLWLLETIHLGLLSHALYCNVVTHHGDLNRFKFTLGIWSIMVQLIPTFLIVVIVQHIWIWRIWTLNQSVWRTTIAMGMAVLSLAGCVLLFTWFIRRYPDTHSADVIDQLLLVSLSFLILNDVLSNFTLCFILYRSKNGIRDTDSTLSILMAYAINTGLITCMGSITFLVLVCLTPLKYYHLASHAVFAKVYLNSLLSMLNYRRLSVRQTRQTDTTQPSTSIQLTSMALMSTFSDLCDAW